MKHDLPTGVSCPACGSRTSSVKDTRGHILPSDELITWRRRKCSNGHSFVTYEHSSAMLLEEEAAILLPEIQKARVVIAGKTFRLTEIDS